MSCLKCITLMKDKLLNPRNNKKKWRRVIINLPHFFTHPRTSNRHPSDVFLPPHVIVSKNFNPTNQTRSAGGVHTEGERNMFVVLGLRLHSSSSQLGPGSTDEPWLISYYFRHSHTGELISSISEGTVGWGDLNFLFKMWNCLISNISLPFELFYEKIFDEILQFIYFYYWGVDTIFVFFCFLHFILEIVNFNLIICIPM